MTRTGSADSGIPFYQEGGGGANPTPVLNGKAWQRLIREQKENEGGAGTLLGSAMWDGVDTDIKRAVVRPISYAAAKDVILEYEWLGNMGTTEYSFGIFWDNRLAGVACFGRTAGTNVYSSVCGAEHKHRVITLCRGACVHWAHPHAASKLITVSCRLMRANGYNVFIAYSDTDAGEIGTVYQACNWMYCGRTSATEKFRAPDGTVRDARLVSAYTRDRRGGELKYKRSRAEQKRMMLDAGCVFFKGNRKHRYVNIVGNNKHDTRTLRSALQWPVSMYPKRSNHVHHPE